MNSDFDLDNDRTLQHLTPGAQIFGRYTLLQLLGNGRKGDVWRARDENLGMDVALKVLRAYPRFSELEAQSGQLMNLSHHAIIRFYDIAGDARLGGFVMEYFESRPLSAILAERDRQPFEVNEIRRWVQDLFSALAYAHEKLGILHRDIRLANLLIQEDGVMKVSEFGLAPAQVGMDEAGHQHLPALSPQVLVGEEHTVQDDLYAAAAAVYEMLTGKPVFASGNIQLQIQRKIPPTLAARRAELQLKGEAIPKDWEEWIARCLDKEPTGRPASAKEVLQILEAGAPVQRGVGTSRRPALANVGDAVGTAVGNLREKDFSWATRLIKGAVALALLGGAVWWFWLKPLEAELEDRRSVIAELEALEASSREEVALVNKSGRDISAMVSAQDTAQKAARRWQQYVEDYESDTIAFSNEDDMMLREARRRQRVWEDEVDSLEKKIVLQKVEIREDIQKLDEAFAKERDEDAKLEQKSTADQMSIAQDRFDAWDRFIREHSGGRAAKTAESENMLAKASAARDQWKGLLERKEKEAEDWIGRWEKAVQGLEANFMQSEKTKPEKLEQVRAKLQELAKEQVPLTATAASKLSEFTTRLRKLETEVLSMADPMPVDLGPFPKTLAELFKHSPLADKPEPQLKAALKKMQQQFKDQQLYNSTIDGAPGPALEAALKAWQEKNSLPVTGHLDAATWATTEIGMMKVEDLIKEIEATSPMVAETSPGTRSSRSKSKRSPKGKDYSNNPPSRGYYSSLTMGKIRLLKDTVGGRLNDPGGKLKPEAAKDPQKVKDWNYHLNTWVDYCQWCERQ